MNTHIKKEENKNSRDNYILMSQITTEFKLKWVDETKIKTSLTFGFFNLLKGY